MGLSLLLQRGDSTSSCMHEVFLRFCCCTKNSNNKCMQKERNIQTNASSLHFLPTAALKGLFNPLLLLLLLLLLMLLLLLLVQLQRHLRERPRTAVSFVCMHQLSCILFYYCKRTCTFVLKRRNHVLLQYEDDVIYMYSNNNKKK